MKKFLSFAIAAFISVSLGVSCFAASFNSASGTCTVDGVKDDAYTVATAIPVNYIDGEAIGSATVYSCWDESNMYYFCEVTDDTITAECSSTWESDSMEIYFNLAGENGELASINAGQYTAGINFTAWAGGGAHWTANTPDASFASVKTAAGWDIEMVIPFGADYKPEAGKSVPFAAAFNNDADGTLGRECQLMTGANQSDAWSVCNENWDTLVFTADKYVAPVVEEVPATTEEETAPTNAAQTFDTVAVMAAVMGIALAGVVVAKKARG